MGHNLLVYRRKNGRFVEEVPQTQWNSGGCVGDREFATQVLSNESITETVQNGGTDGERYSRPRDIDAWKAWDAAYHCNNGRWSALADLLASDPELFVYHSW